MNIDLNSKKLIDLLISAGYKAYAVGGCVRDYIMGRTGGDVDITTSAKPDEVEAVLSENSIRFVETGLKHGTVTAIIDHIPYEITTFRTDGEYIDNRHPESVMFVDDLKKDLARRDFTMNAIAFNDNEGYVDLYGGINDIKNGIIRCVGDPDKRFNEDALRIMRAIRFSSVLGFNIEEKTKKAIFDNKELLLNIAVERLFVEIQKLLMGDNVENVLLEYRDVIATIIPEFKPCFDFPQRTKWHLYDVYTHIVKSVAVAPKKEHIRLTMLFHDIGKPDCLKTDERGVDHFKGHPKRGVEIANAVLSRFKTSNELKNKVCVLIENHDDYIKNNKVSVKSWLKLLGADLTYDYIDVKIADLKAHNLEHAQFEVDYMYEIRELLDEVIMNNEPYNQSHLKVNGNDIKSLGFNGKEIAKVLDELVYFVINNPDKNNKQDLIEHIKNG